MKTLSPFRIMWIFVLFDLPTTGKEDTKNAQKFVKDLKLMGFSRFQFSGYHKFCRSQARMHKIIKDVKAIIPRKGKVSVFFMTDFQFGKIETFFGSALQKQENRNGQLNIF